MKVSWTILAAGLLAFGALRAPGELANGIIAVVDESVITYHEVSAWSEQGLETLLRQYRYQPAVLEQKVNKLRNDNLGELEDRQLILHEFKTAGYNLPESVIDDLVQERIRLQYKDRVTLDKMLQAEGLTFEKYRKQIRDRFIIEQMRYKNIAQEIIISPHKVESYYLAHKEDFQVKDEVRLRMIVLTNSPTQNEEQTRQLGEELLAKLNEGAAFAELAKMYSQGSQRNQGGDRGWEEIADLRKELAEAAAKLKPGEHSGFIQTPEADYLLFVEDRRASHFKSLVDVRADIEKNLLLEERNRLEKQWIARLKKKTFVRINF